MISPDFIALETAGKGYIVSPSFTALLKTNRGYTVNPAYIALETADKGYIASPVYTALEAIGRGLLTSTTYIAIEDISRGIYACRTAYYHHTLECTYRCYVYSSSTDSYIETDCETLGIPLPQCEAACDCCLTNECYRERDIYKSCSQTYNYGDIRVVIICNAKCIPFQFYSRSSQ